MKAGTNVYIKSEKSKLNPRHMYTIIKTYEKDGEHYATVQKRQSHS